MSARSCPDWPRLMELAPELQFKHYGLREAELPASALIALDPARLEHAQLCCDLDHHVFNPDHSDPALAAALLASHWLELGEWVTRLARGTAVSLDPVGSARAARGARPA